MEHGQKFPRLKTVASLATVAEESLSAAEDSSEDEDEIDSEDILEKIAEARERGVGTIDCMETPEGTISTLNLVELARFLEGCDMDDSDEEEDESECEAEGLENYEPTCGRSRTDGTVAGDACVGGVHARGCLEVAKPVVYSGSFQDYRADSAKFGRFRTLSSFGRAVHQNAVVAATTGDSFGCAQAASLDTVVLDQDVPREEATLIFEGASPGNVPCQLLALAKPPSMKEHASMYMALSVPTQSLSPAVAAANVFVAESKTDMIIEGALHGSNVSCQLLALCKPPSIEGETFVFTTLSDASVKDTLRWATRGTEAIAKTAVAEAPTESSRSKKVKKNHFVSLNCAEAGVTASPTCKSAHRFHFGAVELQNLSSSKLSKLPNGGFGLRAKDDGSNWTVDHSLSGKSTSLLGPSWGAGGSVLQPLCQGKFNSDQPVKVTLPKLPGIVSSGLMEQKHEAMQLRLSAVCGPRSVF